MRHAKRQQMAQEAAKQTDPKRRFPVFSVVAALLFAGALGFGGYQAMMHPDTPLPREWNPTKPLRVSDPVTPLTVWKLNRAAATSQTCLAALADNATLAVLPDLETSDQCHIRDRVTLRGVGDASLGAIETRCAIALRLAMWERHSLQPLARDMLGTTVAGIDHFGSYSCRAMRTSAGTTSRMSTHATADAIDISGFRLADGRSLRLIDDWDGPGDAAAFLQAARDGACDWFSLTLSPDYNSLHEDHFHLQSRGWGLCR